MEIQGCGPGENYDFHEIHKAVGKRYTTCKERSIPGSDLSLIAQV
jgi:hypothetical protein